MVTMKGLLLAAPLLALSAGWAPFDSLRIAQLRAAAGLAATAPAAELAQASVPSLSSVVENLQRAVDGIRDFAGSFQQTAVQVALGEPRVSRGEVAYRRPGQMVWDYAGVDGQMGRMLILDGTQLWSIDLEQEQYYTTPLSGGEIPVAMRFLVGEGKLADDFDIALASGSTAERVALDLVPKVPSGDYARLRLIVTTTDWRIVETTVVDALGNTNTLRFSQMRYNAGVDAALFAAEVPPGFTRVSVPE